MRFDAYAGNVPADSFGLRDLSFLLAHDLGGKVTPGRPLRRYGQVLRVEVGPRCAVWCGEDTGNGLLYFEAKGETTPDLVCAMRSRFPDGHTVTRADVAEDYDAQGGFDRVQALIKAHKGPRVKSGYIALPDDPDDGRTWAVGKRGGDSAAYLRLYEAGKMADRAHYGRPDWFRAELEARPRYAADKAAAASMSPVEFFGLTAWTKRVGDALLGIDVPRYSVPQRHYDFDKTTRYLATAFRRHLEQLRIDLGDWECVGREFEAVWTELDKMA